MVDDIVSSVASPNQPAHKHARASQRSPADNGGSACPSFLLGVTAYSFFIYYFFDDYLSAALPVGEII
jgi:hypothetical protein